MKEFNLLKKKYNCLTSGIIPALLCIPNFMETSCVGQAGTLQILYGHLKTRGRKSVAKSSLIREEHPAPRSEGV